MHTVERATRLAAPADDVRALLRVLGRLRWRLGLERTLVFAVRGLTLGAAVLIVLSCLAWLTRLDLPLGLAILPVAAALLVAIVRWPSTRQAADQADHRLHLAERLGTAVELMRQPHLAGRFDRLQVRDALASAHATPVGWLALDRRLRRDALLAALLVVLALGSRLLVDLPRPQLPGFEDAPSTSDAPPVDADRSLPDEALDALSPLPSSDQLPAPSLPATNDPNLAAQVQQGQAEREALDQLSNALGQISAGQAAAEAIQRGDYAGASAELSHLGDNADQLSDAAKQQLAQALQAAANANSGDRQLATAERQAAQAFSRGAYAEQRQALQQLGQQLERSGARSVPADQLAREVGQLQQQQQGQGQSQGQGTAQGQSGTSQGAAGRAQGGQAASATAGGQDAGGSGNGQQGGPGVGTGAGGDPLGDPNPRLATAGQRVDVPTKLGQGPGVRPPTGNEDQSAANPSSGPRSVAENALPQQTGQVAPEQNLVPGEQRPVVRGYFH